jgi:predicted DCC family thiol-disulfide oxidoreductase YuxK
VFQQTIPYTFAIAMHPKPIILFDGICNLCNGAVQFVIRHDPGEIFLFASLQSEAGQQLLKQYNLPATDFGSFTLVQDNKVYTKSTGALKVAKQIKGAWSSLSVFIIVPKFIRDAVYTWIAKNRYRWFGKKDSCMIPTPELKGRFL